MCPQARRTPRSLDATGCVVNSGEGTQGQPESKIIGPITAHSLGDCKKMWSDFKTVEMMQASFQLPERLLILLKT